jgi:hypothetical protein
MRLGGVDPCWILAQLSDARGVSRPRPALPKCEARFQLLNWAGLRGLFRASRAVPTWENRPTKQPILIKSLLRWELLGWPGLPNTPLMFDYVGLADACNQIIYIFPICLPAIKSAVNFEIKMN